MPWLPKDLSGLTFGRFTVVEFAGIVNRHARWKCVCTCGREKIIFGSNLPVQMKLCDCLGREERRRPHPKGPHRGLRHSQATTPEYKAFYNARRRCENQKVASFKYYGARGIEFRFESFEQFIAEIGTRPTPKHSLDRIDNNGHYERGNVKWSTHQEQMLNRQTPFRPRHKKTL